MKRLLALLAVSAFGYALFFWLGLPSRKEVRALAKRNPDRTGVMRQREEEAQAAGRAPRRLQTWVPLSRISRHLIHAVVVAEDPKFFGHEGLDWEAIRESLEKNVRERRFARGGSTISQQMTKNVFFTTHKSLTRKLRELVAVRWVEAELTKARILEIYLNVIEWGDGVYGCEAAAHRYYNKPAAALTELEAAGLAAMVPSPRRINPRVNRALHAKEQRRILWWMARVGYVKRDIGELGAEPQRTFVDESGPDPVEPDEDAPSGRETPAPIPTPPPAL